MEDGTIPQVEMTSSGPNGSPLIGEGEHPAYLTCNLFCQDEEAGYIMNMTDSATARFKYFECQGIKK